MKIFGLLCFILTLNTFAADYSLYENILQSKLGFAGKVEVNDVKETTKGRTFVSVDVTSYGETRPNWCIFEGTEVLQCMDNWFYKN